MLVLQIKHFILHLLHTWEHKNVELSQDIKDSWLQKTINYSNSEDSEI